MRNGWCLCETLHNSVGEAEAGLGRKRVWPGSHAFRRSYLNRLGFRSSGAAPRTALTARQSPAAGSRPSTQCRFSSELFEQAHLVLRRSADQAADVLHGPTRFDEGSRQVRQVEQRRDHTMRR